MESWNSMYENIVLKYKKMYGLAGRDWVYKIFRTKKGFFFFLSTFKLLTRPSTLDHGALKSPVGFF